MNDVPHISGMQHWVQVWLRQHLKYGWVGVDRRKMENCIGRYNNINDIMWGR